MASAAVISAIETYLRANWAHTPIRGFDDEPDSPVPANASAFAEITFPVEPDEEQKSIGAPGSNVFRETGAFRFCVMFPRKGERMSVWAGRIDDLRDDLRNLRLLSGHLRIFETPPPAISGRSDREGYRELSIAVAYEYDIFR